jgi:3-oxoacyl-(acyl-carrier-protein) synthase
MPFYISSAEAISPQHTFQAEDFPSEVVQPEGEYFTCIHPDYKQFIQPGALRRMSPVIRMGLASAMVALRNADIEKPDAILVGTGLGCVQDTVRFLKQVIDQDEQLLNPTAFIQSTHNTVAGQLALILGCREHNLTFTQKSLSFETALLEALLMVEEQEDRQVLVGGIDETVEESYRLMVRSGCARAWTGGDLLTGDQKGAVPGEGSAFFLLSGSESGDPLAKIDDLAIIPRFADGEQLEAELGNFLERNGTGVAGVDLLVSGRNGDAGVSHLYDRIEAMFSHSVVAGYKHLVGEYDTASAFGAWLASAILQRKSVPETVIFSRGSQDEITRCLAMNLSKDHSASFLLFSGPDS